MEKKKEKENSCYIENTLTQIRKREEEKNPTKLFRILCIFHDVQVSLQSHWGLKDLPYKCRNTFAMKTFILI